MNPYGYPPRPSFGTEHGFYYSGSAKEVFGDGKVVGVLRIATREFIPQGYAGLASVHVFEKDVTVVDPGQEIPNARLILNVSWQSGDGGGEAEVDATGGSFFTVGGVTALNLNARLDTAVEGLEIVPWATKRVEATVNWLTSRGPHNAIMTGVSKSLLMNQASSFYRIPLQSYSMMVDTRQPESLSTLRAEFSTSDQPTGLGVKYAVLDPNGNGTTIHSGVEFVRFISPVPMTVIPVFELQI